MANDVTQDAYLKVYEDWVEYMGKARTNHHTVAELMHYLEIIADKYGDETEVLISVEPGITEGHMSFRMNIVGKEKVPQLLLVPDIPTPMVPC